MRWHKQECSPDTLYATNSGRVVAKVVYEDPAWVVWVGNRQSRTILGEYVTQEAAERAVVAQFHDTQEDV